ncbi:MAG: hypothetical protein GC172_02455 [Phycisphaera sp.]|nr:hypothetical protein [Phycisphaera sp.]
MHRVRRSWLRTLGGAVASAALLPAAAVAPWVVASSPLSAQTLDLDGVRQGPAIPAENGALDLASALEDERARLEESARLLRGEAQASAEARIQLRQIAIMLLRSGSSRPWSESGPVVLGLRVANLIREADAAIEAAAAGRRRPDGRALPADDAKAAMAALRALGAMPLDRLQGAMRRDAGTPARIVEALAQVLAPLATVVRIVEGAEPLDPWPVLDFAPDTPSAPRSAADTVEALRARVAALKSAGGAEGRSRGGSGDGQDDGEDGGKNGREVGEENREEDGGEDGAGGAPEADGPSARGDLVGAEIVGRIEATLDGIATGSIPDRTLVRGVSSAVRVTEWIVAVRSLPLPRPVDDSVVASVESQVSRAIEELARTAKADSAASDGASRESGPRGGALDGTSRAVDELAALETVIDACDDMLALRRSQGSSDLARRALSEAIAALAAGDARSTSSGVNTSERGSGTGLRSAARAAARISEACRAAERLEKSAAGDAPREFREVVRALDRDARIAVRALPEACRALALDPVQASDPGMLAPFTRVLTLDADRARIIALHGLVARIGAVRPKAAQGIEGATRRLARTLLDPIKRTDAQRGFATVEGLAAAAFPFPFEDELLRRTDRAVALAGGNPEQLLEVAAQARVAWAEAVGRGDLGGPDAVWLDEVSRFFAAMRDLSSLAGPVTRGDADRLALWGGWTARRALIAPATVDLDARAVLAARSLVGSARTGDRGDFRRDLSSLERAIPLVRLVSRLERAVSPHLGSEPSSTAAMLAPLVHAPGADAAFVREWSRLLMLDRALLESEYARRKGLLSVRDELAAFMSDLARDIEVGAFGAAVSIGAIPGFDGSDSTGDAERKPTGTGSPRRR